MSSPGADPMSSLGSMLPGALGGLGGLAVAARWMPWVAWPARQARWPVGVRCGHPARHAASAGGSRPAPRTPPSRTRTPNPHPAAARTTATEPPHPQAARADSRRRRTVDEDCPSPAVPASPASPTGEVARRVDRHSAQPAGRTGGPGLSGRRHGRCGLPAERDHLAAVGTPVTSPVDPTRLTCGDVAMFKDHYEPVLSSVKGYLNGQVRAAGAGDLQPGLPRVHRPHRGHRHCSGAGRPGPCTGPRGPGSRTPPPVPAPLPTG